MLAQPQAENVLVAPFVHADRQIRRRARQGAPGAHRSGVPHLDVDRVQIHDRVRVPQRPALPLRVLLHHHVGHPRDQIGRHLDAVQLPHRLPDPARRHAPGEQMDHLVVEARKTPAVLLHQLRLERALAVPRNLQRHGPRVGEHRLGVVAVARVAGNALLRLRQVDLHLRVQDPLGQLAAQLGEKLAAMKQSRQILVLQHLVQHRFGYAFPRRCVRHCSSPFRPCFSDIRAAMLAELLVRLIHGKSDTLQQVDRQDPGSGGACLRIDPQRHES